MTTAVTAGPLVGSCFAKVTGTPLLLERGIPGAWKWVVVRLTCAWLLPCRGSGRNRNIQHNHDMARFTWKL